MTEAEKQAIETMKHWIDYEKNNKDKINKADELIEIQETLLNLIERQQKEIKEAYWKGYTARDTEAQNICKSCKYRTKEIKDLQTEIERQKDMYRHLSRDSKKAVDYTFELNKEIEKQDKIIDEMAKYIAGLEIEEDICVKTGRLDECDSMAYGECENCIKEYFKKKVQKT